MYNSSYHSFTANPSSSLCYRLPRSPKERKEKRRLAMMETSVVERNGERTEGVIGETRGTGRTTSTRAGHTRKLKSTRGPGPSL